MTDRRIPPAPSLPGAADASPSAQPAAAAAVEGPFDAAVQPDPELLARPVRHDAPREPPGPAPQLEVVPAPPGDPDPGARDKVFHVRANDAVALLGSCRALHPTGLRMELLLPAGDVAPPLRRPIRITACFDNLLVPRARLQGRVVGRQTTGDRQVVAVELPDRAHELLCRLAAITIEPPQAPVRRHPRFTVSMSLRLRGPSGTWHPVHMTGLSAGGATLRCPGEFAPGEGVTLSARGALGLARVAVPASVVWVQGGAEGLLGVRFDLDAPDAPRAVERLLARLAPRRA